MIDVLTDQLILILNCKVYLYHKKTVVNIIPAAVPITSFFKGKRKRQRNSIKKKKYKNKIV